MTLARSHAGEHRHIGPRPPIRPTDAPISSGYIRQAMGAHYRHTTLEIADRAITAAILGKDVGGARPAPFRGSTTESVPPNAGHPGKEV